MKKQKMGPPIPDPKRLVSKCLQKSNHQNNIGFPPRYGHVVHKEGAECLDLLRPAQRYGDGLGHISRQPVIIHSVHAVAQAGQDISMGGSLGS